MSHCYTNHVVILFCIISLTFFSFISCFFFFYFFFFNDTATTEIYTLSLHDAFPISREPRSTVGRSAGDYRSPAVTHLRSEEHTSELQSLTNLVCRLLLEKKKKKKKKN